jgi:hypothetical protein
MCIPQHAAQVRLATQAETLQVWHERPGHQNKRHVMKCSSNMVLMWKQKKIVTAVLREEHIGRASELG